MAPPPDADLLELLREIGLRAEVSRRLEAGASDALLRSIVESAVVLFRAAAASIALHDPLSDQLVFRVAAGAQGQGILGQAIAADRGIAGHAFVSGQPIAIVEAAVDARFARDVAEASGYLPRTLLAVPIEESGEALGVLEVLDKGGGLAFDLRDLDLAGLLARQAGAGIRMSRLERDVARLLRAGLARLLGEERSPASSAAEQALVAVAAAGAEADDPGLWELVEAIATIRRDDPQRLPLTRELLDLMARDAGRRRGGTGVIRFDP